MMELVVHRYKLSLIMPINTNLKEEYFVRLDVNQNLLYQVASVTCWLSVPIASVWS